MPLDKEFVSIKKNQTIQVPAGSFDTTYCRIKMTGDPILVYPERNARKSSYKRQMWLSPLIPINSTVKIIEEYELEKTSKENSKPIKVQCKDEIVLIEYAFENAVSRIRETPIPYERTKDIEHLIQRENTGD